MGKDRTVTKKRGETGPTCGSSKVIPVTGKVRKRINLGGGGGHMSRKQQGKALAPKSEGGF